MNEDIREDIGGCAEPDLWENDGSNCKKCEWFDVCGEGQYMVNNQEELT